MWMALPTFWPPIEPKAMTLPSPTEVTEFHNECSDMLKSNGAVMPLKFFASASPTATNML